MSHDTAPPPPLPFQGRPPMTAPRCPSCGEDINNFDPHPCTGIVGEDRPPRHDQSRPPTDPRAAPGEHIMQFFKFDHLPTALRAVSQPFHDMAVALMLCLPRNPERTVALRKLLESKDAAVRAAIADPATP